MPDEVCSLQVYFYATIQGGGRNALRGREFQELPRILEIINNGVSPEKYDKNLIAKYAGLSYVKAEDDKISMLIPYLKKNEYEKLDKILLEVESELGDDFFVDYIEGYMKTVKKQLPDFLPDNEKNYVATGICSITAIPYYLAEHGRLRYPTDEEAKRLGILIWEIK